MEDGGRLGQWLWPDDLDPSLAGSFAGLRVSRPAGPGRWCVGCAQAPSLWLRAELGRGREGASRDSPALPSRVSGEEPACRCRRCKRRRFDPWVRKTPWRRAWQPTPGFLPGEPHGQRSLAGCSPRGRRVGHDLATKQQQRPTRSLVPAPLLVEPTVAGQVLLVRPSAWFHAAKSPSL